MTIPKPRPRTPDLIAVFLLAAAGCAPPVGGGGIDPEAVRTFLLDGIERSKVMDVRFAEAIPDSAFAWAPNAEVRKFGEQLGHAADNYWISSGLGVESPAFGGGDALESREALVAAITAAYDWLAARLQEIPAEELNTTADFFGGTTAKWRMFTQALEHAYWTRGQTVPYFHAHGVDVPGVTFF